MNVLKPVLLERLRNDHVRLSKVLTVMRDHIGETAGGTVSRTDWFAHLTALMAYISEYPDIDHHPVENRLCDSLVDHGLTPVERSLVERNLAEHAELTATSRRLSEELQAMSTKGEACDTEEDEAEFCKDMRAYLTMQLEHIRREEEHLFPLAEKMLTSADWQMLESQSRHLEDPMFHQRQTRFYRLYQLVTESG